VSIERGPPRRASSSSRPWRGGCGQRVRVPLDVYERVRSQDDRFVVRPGHETPELERAVEWTSEYVVVDKIPAAEPYVEDDPRGAPSS